jgi:hypothetical protein
MFPIKVIAVFLSLFIFFLVIELIRRERLTFKYAAGWLGITSLGVLLAIFDKIVFKIAQLLGFELTSNFIFFALLSIFVFLSLLMTVFLCQQNNRNDVMAQKIGILEHEIENLKKEKKGAS